MADRPSDETTGKVVGELCKALNPPPIDPTVDYYNEFWLCDGVILASTRDHPETRDYYMADPRDDTDAALELLGWLRNNTKANISMGERGFHLRTGSWRSAKTGMRATFGSVDDDSLAPYGGQPFRYAVVEFAAKVLGVG